MAIGVLAFSGYKCFDESNILANKMKAESLDENKTAAIKNYTQENKSINTTDSSCAIVFYKNQELYSIQFENGKAFGLSKISDENIEIARTAKYFTTSLMPKEVISSILLSTDMIFYSGLQSNIFENEWLYVERNMESSTYNLCFYNDKNKIKSILFSQKNSPDRGYAFKPIAWSLDGLTVFLEALVFGSSTEHEGIWEYDLYSKAANRINISPNYSNTPQISPDGKYLLYCATTLNKDVHVPSNKVLIYDINARKEFLVFEDSDSIIVMAEWATINR